MLWNIFYSMEDSRPYVNVPTGILCGHIRGKGRRGIVKRDIRRVNQRGPDPLGALLIEPARLSSETVKPPDWIRTCSV